MQDAALPAKMVTAHKDLHGNPEVRRMLAHLTAEGHQLSSKRVHRSMQAADLRGCHPRAWKVTTIAGDNPVPAPDLIGRKFTAEAPNLVWCGDITYIKTSWIPAVVATLVVRSVSGSSEVQQGAAAGTAGAG